MQLLQSWKESLAILWPSNLKLFLLVTLNSIKKSLWIWLSFIVVLLPIMFFLQYFHYYSLPAQLNVFYETLALLISIGSFIGFIILFPVFFVLMFLVIRPSIQKKSWRYVVSYWRHIFYAIIIMAGIFVALRYWYSYFSRINDAGFYVSTWQTYCYDFVISPFLIVGFIFCMFFLLDSKGYIVDVMRSLGRAFIMVGYNLPILLIIAWAFMPFWRMLYLLKYHEIIRNFSDFLIIFGYNWIWFAIASLIYFVFVNIMSILYTKQVHEHFSRYFPQEGV